MLVHADATRQRKADAELAKQREYEKAARSYDSLFSGNAGEEEDDDDEFGQDKASRRPQKSVRELEEDFM